MWLIDMPTHFPNICISCVLFVVMFCPPHHHHHLPCALFIYFSAMEKQPHRRSICSPEVADPEEREQTWGEAEEKPMCLLEDKQVEESRHLTSPRSVPAAPAPLQEALVLRPVSIRPALLVSKAPFPEKQPHVLRVDATLRRRTRRSFWLCFPGPFCNQVGIT